MQTYYSVEVIVYKPLSLHNWIAQNITNAPYCIQTVSDRKAPNFIVRTTCAVAAVEWIAKGCATCGLIVDFIVTST